jgi:glycosyltransferase involved in cell wall biosynthesis
VRVAAPPIVPYGRFGPRPSFGILSSYPPTPCGLATFTAALARGLTGKGADVRVVRVADDHSLSPDPVIGELVNGSPASVAASAELLNQCDVAIVQHEYGLFGGRDGDEVLSILGGLRVPSIVIAHTILADPTPHQRDVLVAVAALADQVVVMSEAARVRLCTTFDVDPTRVVTIAHGAAIAASAAAVPAATTTAAAATTTATATPQRRSLRPFSAARPPQPSRPVLLTWGLIGPGKGIERMLDAMPALHQLPMQPQYLVAGSTHPKVLAADGEAYRDARIAQARRLGVADSVRFDDDYRDLASLNALIASAAIVVLPYDSTDQVTSGVLVDAIAAGKPVVATAFPHAVELLASGAGLVVDHAAPDAMAAAIRRVLLEPGLADHMATQARRIAPSLGWPVVAAAYLELADRLRSARRVLV